MQRKIIELEYIDISLDIAQEWLRIAQDLWPRLIEILWPDVRPDDIPFEQFLVLENGDGQIFVDLPNDTKISLDVPKWKRNYASLNN